MDVKVLARAAMLLLLVIGSPQTQASDRWDLLRWCGSQDAEDVARCEGFLRAALDMKTYDEFAGLKSCFRSGTGLVQVREEVVRWLSKNKVAQQQSGLALVLRALEERFPCASPQRPAADS